jgi:hypothetical protein
MKNKHFYLSLLVCFISFISCRKNKDTIPPTIELISPNENDTLTSSNSDYQIKFNAHDETELSKENISIKDMSGAILTTENRVLYGSDYYYSNSFLFKGTKGQLKKLILSIQIEDNAKNITVKSIPFFVKL